jgi:hypothetical protein
MLWIPAHGARVDKELGIPDGQKMMVKKADIGSKRLVSVAQELL